MHRPTRRALALLGLVALAAAGLTAVAGPSSAAGIHTWAVTAAPQPAGSESDSLARVSCLSTTFCMAVGAAAAEQWNGTAWSAQTVTVPAGGQLRDVSCASISSCMAVGDVEVGIREDGFVETWDGTTWSLAATEPSPGGSALSVSCVSTTFCVVTGQSLAGQPTAGIWDGTAWTTTTFVVSTTEFAELDQVSCTSATFCFAVGTIQSEFMIAYAWNGTNWTGQNGFAETNRLENVSCVSPTDCEAVDNTGSTNIAVLWNGSTFVSQTMPNEGAQSLFYDISCASAAACIAVGGRPASAGVVPVIEKYDGITWTAVAAPKPTAATLLNGVDCVTVAACVAVGEAPDSAQIEHDVVESTFQPVGATAARLTEKLSDSALLPGQTLALTATLAPNPGGGTVSFSSDNTIVAGCGAVPISKVGAAYEAVCTTSATAVGTHAENVVFTGLGKYLPAGTRAPFMVINPVPAEQQYVNVGVAFKNYGSQLEDPNVTQVTWRVISGSLPAGLKLASDGLISGTPTGAEFSEFDVAAVRTAAPARSDTFSVAISIAGLTVSTPAGHTAVLGKSFRLQLAATGGKSQLTWSSTGLPSGITLSKAGVLTGTFKTVGSYSIPVAVHDSRTPTPQMASSTIVVTVQ